MARPFGNTDNSTLIPYNLFVAPVVELDFLKVTG